MVKLHGWGARSFSGDKQYVELEDYLSLQAALREALTEWQGWVEDQLEGTRGWIGTGGEQMKRIADLKKQFLDI